MSSLPPSPASPCASRWALGLAAALLGGLACDAAFSAVSRSNAAALERFEETTGFGDAHYFTVPLEPSAVPAASLDGKPLFLDKEEKKTEQRDTRMVRTGRDEAAGLFIYTPRDPVDGKEGSREKAGSKSGYYYLKTGPDEYIKLRPGKK